MLRIGLVGNPNSGKTTLFNRLTGANQKIGNFPGVTIEKKVGKIKSKNIEIVDLPGIYSLSPYSKEEIVTRDFLFQDKPDIIINIIDATNFERNLYLTLQLLELNIPTIIALNMMDEVQVNGDTIDEAALASTLGTKVIAISAMKNAGISDLIELLDKDLAQPLRRDFCSGEVHKAIHAILHIIEEKAKEKELPCKFCAGKLVEGDKILEKQLELSKDELHIISHIIQMLEKDLGVDKEAAIIDSRYEFIENLANDAVIKKKHTNKKTEKIDAVLTHKVFALPIFAIIMLAIFQLTFVYVGGFLSEWLTTLIDGGIELIDRVLASWGANSFIHSLLIDGVFAGVGSVLSFLPIIITLFFFLSILEDTGYMARIAFVMDKLVRKIGLTGRSFVPMLLGFGCSVPAIMATRTLSSERDRKLTILLIPFMSCSAKLTIYALFVEAFFSSHQSLIMLSLYFLGMLVAVAVGFIISRIKKNNKPAPFVMELPNYRMPSLKTCWRNLYEKSADFVARAFTIILGASIIIWLLQTFNFRFDIVEDATDSMLAFFGKIIAPAFAPLGFGNWIASTALITGLIAKEAVVSTINVLGNISTIFSAKSAYVFLVFILLYMPCVAAMAAVKRELNSSWNAVKIMAFQTFVAWVVALIVSIVLQLF